MEGEIRLHAVEQALVNGAWARLQLLLALLSSCLCAGRARALLGQKGKGSGSRGLPPAVLFPRLTVTLPPPSSARARVCKVLCMLLILLQPDTSL